MTFTIDDESMPPDRHVPAGTSATSRRSTDRSKRGAELGRVGRGVGRRACGVQ